jgi:hypothetical protein
VTFKEVRLSPKIGTGDFDTKVHRAIEFLEDGDRIKVTVRFRGRELTHPELGRNLLAKFVDRVKDHGVAERTPLLEGKSMHITMASVHKPKVHEVTNRHDADSLNGRAEENIERGAPTAPAAPVAAAAPSEAHPAATPTAAQVTASAATATPAAAADTEPAPTAEPAPEPAPAEAKAEAPVAAPRPATKTAAATTTKTPAAAPKPRAEAKTTTTKTETKKTTTPAPEPVTSGE